MKPPIVPRKGMMTPTDEVRAKDELRLGDLRPLPGRHIILEIESIESSPHGQNESNVWPSVPGLPYCLKITAGHDGVPRVHMVTEPEEALAMKVLALLCKETP